MIFINDDVLAFFGQIILSAIGAGGLISVYLQSRLNKKEKEADQKKEYREKKAQLEAEYRSAMGNFSFWLARGCERYDKAEKKDYWNGETQKAYEYLKNTENKIEELERAMLAKKIE